MLNDVLQAFFSFKKAPEKAIGDLHSTTACPHEHFAVKSKLSFGLKLNLLQILNVLFLSALHFLADIIWL